uniref:ZZ-type domain-containing protein n=1 Tax=Kwoniella bestiolae CBS 10118 TaxID=1296100 RepID=A0A1B9G6N7_9TREE|nr:hypothetical protein I302_04391 [Kwoniella bestiolae CBS 10118]OCF26704.1 hypothetical protein I302_04391 [Kwoniella bestiolae CBS 10118]
MRHSSSGPSALSASASDRPNRPLVIKCAFDGNTRRVTFPSAATCRLDSLRDRVEECFSLSASPFSLAYTDDDGEEFSIKTDRDLTDAITYFISGDDDAALSTYSGSNSGNMMYAYAAQKITIRLDVLVEYDGPSLSDTSSISSFQTGTGSYEGSHRDGTSQGSWRSSGYEESLKSSRRSSGFDAVHEVNDEYSSEESTIQRFDSLEINHQQPSSAHHSASTERSTPLGFHDNPPPSLLTHSDLGTRWLQEQSRLASRKLGPAPKSVSRPSNWDSDEDSDGSDDERQGDIALVRDARGRYYYSYHTDASSRSSHSEHEAGPSNRPFSQITLSTSPPQTPLPYESVRIAEPTGPPILAPDCSACGTRLDYMRYVCQTCGEGELWKENASGKPEFAAMSGSDSDSSSEATSRRSTDSQTVYNDAIPSTVTGSQGISNTQSSPTTATYRYGLTPPDSPLSLNGELPTFKSRGYELCAGCIEVHGIAHAKASAAKLKSSHAERRRRRQGCETRHTFREKTWAAEGWVDVDYSEDTQCTICRNHLFANRYKCVSCPSFDLCATCYQKVEEIHPAHTFLSLPDKLLPSATSLGLEEVSPPPRVVPQPTRHPGAFCHNCLQDIVGPRFHCAVCAVDLCIQCEAVVLEVNGTSHTADHIMMKIPVPISSTQVDAVSRRARDRWFQQDRTVAAGTISGDGEASSRSSSPTNDTVYAPTTNRDRLQTPPTVAITTRDALDHALRCGNCNEWIMGRRFQCANCPSDPEGYNLCSICELRSYRVHDPTHVFLKFDRPVHAPIRSSRPVLPLLYRQPVGKVPTSALSSINPRDPTAYLKHLLHRETLCDVHGDQIRGVWLRCCHCAAGYDLCQEAERASHHDPTHVFVLFKSRVDMAAFRALADLGGAQPKPLLKQRVYVS